jgi:hypothetical protein
MLNQPADLINRPTVETQPRKHVFAISVTHQHGRQNGYVRELECCRFPES